MSGNEQEMKEIKTRLEKLESQMDFLFRRMGIASREAPNWNVSPRILELLKRGDKAAAIRAVMDESGASLKDAKNLIESLPL